MSDKTMADIIAEAARRSDAAHWPEAVEIALTAAGYGLLAGERRTMQLAALLAYDAIEEGALREAGAKALEEAANAWREYLPAVAGYGAVQPVPVWLERRAQWLMVDG